MKIFRYWECRKECIGGCEIRFKAGSNLSPEHAALLVEKKIGIYRRFNDLQEPDPTPVELAELRMELAGESGEYGAPVCEEAVTFLDERNIVTRNRYGALVLNSEDHAFLDIDFENSPSLGFLQKLKGIFCREPIPSCEERLLALIREVLNEKFPYTSARLYRTAKGFRLLLKGEFEPGSEKTQEAMALFRCDPLYAQLCIRQGCFRARLTPKPVRIGVKGGTKFPFPYEAEKEAERKQWCERYEARSADYAVCRLVREFNGGFTTPVVEYHDRICRCGTELPLA